MQDNQIDTLPTARGLMLAAAISSFFWLIIGIVLLVLL